MKFLSALGFLSRIRVPQRCLALPLNSVVHFFPLVGALLGSIVAFIFWFLQLFLPADAAIALSMAASMLITGAFHEDGLADTADAFGGGWSKDQVLSIMKDSRVGSFGALAVSMALLIKFISLSSLNSEDVVLAIIFAHSVSRLLTLPIIRFMNYVRFEGKSKPLADGISLYQLCFALLSVSWFIFLLPSFQILAAISIASACAIHIAFRSQKRIGGFTGDVLGATQQIAEIAIYITLSAKVFN